MAVAHSSLIVLLRTTDILVIAVAHSVRLCLFIQPRTSLIGVLVAQSRMNVLQKNKTKDYLETLLRSELCSRPFVLSSVGASCARDLSSYIL